MERRSFAILLHSHMPYVRRGVDWPVGEQWILEAWAECYLPLWQLIEDMAAGRCPGKLALTMTPILAEQLEDAYLQERFVAYLKNRRRQAEEEVMRLSSMGDERRSRLAIHYARELEDLLRLFEEKYRGGMMSALRRGMEAGVLEVLASSATHAHLPLLSSDACRAAQVEIGLEQYFRCFGRQPAGFWLPECSYTPQLDRVLERFSPPLRYVVLDHTAPDGAPQPVPTWEACRLGRTSLAAFLRDSLSHRLVWEPDGYPSHGEYREYVKRDYQGHGFQYWRITSSSARLEDKEVYEPEEAWARARADAEHFTARMRERWDRLVKPEGTGRPRLVLAAYDTELFGHWWREGPLWLREVLGILGPECELPGRVAAGLRPEGLPILSPPCTAWNVDGTFATWENEGTRDIWEVTRVSEEAFLSRFGGDLDAGKRRALLQAGRELLLMEASDWSYMVTRDTAAGYARDRFFTHAERFRRCMAMLDSGLEEEELALLEEVDNPFSWLRPGHWADYLE
ncbi:1,4-alpha-glucan branching protein domain-containing protein [Candidatus Solincola sp.]|jgi:1,4-alpha-glucan branching enzyme|nr:DUF1957 domain-containing protein [Actinomycetota bacterium]MDI7251369.1 DUF1957 domain-containing protein [Actinomycetota bacterium]